MVKFGPMAVVMSAMFASTCYAQSRAVTAETAQSLGLMNAIDIATSKSYAAFLEGYYDLTGQLKVTVGGRYTYEERAARGNTNASFAAQSRTMRATSSPSGRGPPRFRESRNIVRRSTFSQGLAVSWAMIATGISSPRTHRAISARPEKSCALASMPTIYSTTTMPLSGRPPSPMASIIMPPSRAHMACGWSIYLSLLIGAAASSWG